MAFDAEERRSYESEAKARIIEAFHAGFDGRRNIYVGRAFAEEDAYAQGQMAARQAVKDWEADHEYRS